MGRRGIHRAGEIRHREYGLVVNTRCCFFWNAFSVPRSLRGRPRAVVLLVLSRAPLAQDPQPRILHVCIGPCQVAACRRGRHTLTTLWSQRASRHAPRARAAPSFPPSPRPSSLSPAPTLPPRPVQDAGDQGAYSTRPCARPGPRGAHGDERGTSRRTTALTQTPPCARVPPSLLTLGTRAHRQSSLVTVR